MRGVPNTTVQGFQPHGQYLGLQVGLLILAFGLFVLMPGVFATHNPIKTSIRELNAPWRGALLWHR